MNKMHFDLEDRIINHLIINSYNHSNLGLLSGKMGILIFFLHYSTYKKQCVYEDYAFDILDKILDEISTNTPLGLDTGLIGIGWGIEYILQTKYAMGNEVNICEVIDDKIMKMDPRRIDDLSLDTGLEGLMHYILIHIQNAIQEKQELPFDSLYLSDLYNISTSIQPDKVNARLLHLMDAYKKFYEAKLEVVYRANLFSFINEIQLKEDNIVDTSLGLRNGLAGYLYKNISSI